MKSIHAAVFLVALVALAIIAWLATRPVALREETRLDVAEALGGPADPAFARALAAYTFQFPRDHGPHPLFRNEWWYFTGNLRDHLGRRFGYELALFRIALTPHAVARQSEWGTNQVYMAHFALTDAGGQRFQFFERIARGAAGLAGARAEPFAIWLENWGVHAGRQDPHTWRLTAAADDIAIDVTLAPEKPIVLQGDRGLSQKSDEPGNASYYYSIPRLATRGHVTIGDRRHAVQGTSWLDREWSTSALGSEQVGWDWFALQFDDGTDLMYYQLRQQDGRNDPHSQGVLIGAKGGARRLQAGDVQIEVIRRWQSPRGGSYPAAWRLSVPSEQLTLDVTPVLADQELAVSVRYWEGAVDVAGTRAGRRLDGVGYAELTGYAETKEGSLRRLR